MTNKPSSTDPLCSHAGTCEQNMIDHDGAFCANQPAHPVGDDELVAKKGEARLQLAEQYKGLGLPKILLEHMDFALKAYPGVQVPHYNLAGMFEWAAGDIERLRADNADLQARLERYREAMRFARDELGGLPSGLTQWAGGAAKKISAARNRLGKALGDTHVG
jgi:hypothetical protein